MIENIKPAESLTVAAFPGSSCVDLDGQRVTAVNFAEADTTLEFDLGITVRLGKSIFPTEPGSTLWSLGRFGSPGLVLLNDGAILRGNEVDEKIISPISPPTRKA
ncbi:hypothetical protein [Bradyrhizobium sp.]|uniref:hypothetical protein n=1 Tax=Bradyrhizobium sp. TaxID=376 RepID=UPI00263658B0|nr:hypothetical protein [Bradyrhizobium sp.]